jgi:hypothetical protein
MPPHLEGCRHVLCHQPGLDHGPPLVDEYRNLRWRVGVRSGVQVRRAHRRGLCAEVFKLRLKVGLALFTTLCCSENATLIDDSQYASMVQVQYCSNHSDTLGSECQPHLKIHLLLQQRDPRLLRERARGIEEDEGLGAGGRQMHGRQAGAVHARGVHDAVVGRRRRSRRGCT